MTLKPFRSRVRLSVGGRGMYNIESAEAERLCLRGLAVQVEDVFTTLVGRIELTVSLGALHEHLTPKHRDGRPKPTTRADSSTGDAGRGLGPLIGKHRTLFYGPGPRASGNATKPNMPR